MTDNPLTGRVGLDVTDFKSGISQLNREIRIIESGFRATAAGLGDWAKSATGLEARIKALNGEITIQRSKVAALEGEYKKMAAEKGENSRAAQELQIKINKENEALGRMETELGSTEKALAEFGNESKDAAKGADQLAKEEDQAVSATDRLRGALDKLKTRLKGVASDFRALGTKVLKGVAVGIAGIGVAAIGAAVGLGRLVTNSARAADEIVESAEKMGITTEAYQEFQFVGEQIGTDVETIGRAFARTTKAIAGADEEGTAIAKTLDGLGIATRDATGNLRDTEDVFGDIITALGGMTNETQRDIIAQQLFGKSYQELVPLIELGADGLKEMTDQAHEMGAVMGDEAVQGLADFNDKLGAMKAGFKGLMGRVLAPFLPLVTKIIDKFQEWLASPAVQAGIKTITDGIERFATKLGEVLDKLFAGDIAGALKEFLPPEVVDQITKFAGIFSDFINNTLIPFVTQHAEEIKGALIGIGAALAAAGIVAVIAGVVGAVAALANPVGLIIALAGLLGAAWAGNWGGIREKTQAVIDFLKPYIEAFIAGIRQWWDENGAAILAGVQVIWNGIKTTITTIINVISTVVSTVLGAIKQFWQDHGEAIKAAAQAAWDFIKARIGLALDIIKAIFAAFKSAFEGDWEGFGQNLRKAWDLIWEDIKTSFSKAWEWIKKTFKEIVDNILKFFKETDWAQVGMDIINGIIAGLEKAGSWLKNALMKIAAAALKAFKGFFGIKSPSKLMAEEIGIPMAQGIADGFRRGIQQAANDLTRLTNGTVAGAAGGAGGGRGGRVTNDSRRTIYIYGGLHMTGINDSESLLQELSRLMP